MALFDLHVHTAPDVVARFADDVDTVNQYEEAGFSGCVLKAHHESTVGRANAAGRGRALRVYGGVVLNGAVGGLNPAAAAASLSAGGRVVWMPTVDAAAQHGQAWSHPGALGGTSGHSAVYAVPPTAPDTEATVREILDIVAEHDAVLATGHLGAREVAWLVAAAVEHRVERILLTHPSFTVPSMDAAAVRALANRGAFAEVTAYQLLHQDGCSAAALADFVRAVGHERCVLSSDAGQPNSPSPPHALRALVDALAREGIPPAAAEAMAGSVAHDLVSP